MGDSTFTHVSYIRTTPEQLWTALTDGDVIPQYWFGVHCDSRWTTDSQWALTYPDGTTTDVGEIIEVVPKRQLVIRWRHQARPALRPEGESRCTIAIEPSDRAVKLSLTHSIPLAPSAFISAVSEAWPMVLSNLKSLLETGSVVLDRPWTQQGESGSE
jgi:uncharacterized protein YndB with AHSA1/START domain